MACDLCGVKGTTLEEVSGSFQTSEVRYVCPGCRDTLNKELDRIRSTIGPKMRAFIEAEYQRIHGAKPQESPASRLSRMGSAWLLTLLVLLLGALLGVCWPDDWMLVGPGNTIERTK